MTEPAAPHGTTSTLPPPLSQRLCAAPARARTAADPGHRDAPRKEVTP